MTPRAESLFARSQRELHVKTDRLMLAILLGQWALAIVLALVLSPYTWAGRTRSVHLHVELAFGLGAAINALPIGLIVMHPGRRATRQVIAVSQMLWSALLIHLTGGRIETHFHIFGSLAFLATYRDWTLLPTATVMVAADHLVRGLLLPESVYGAATAEWWRFLEHAAWVAFEDVVLIIGCVRGRRELALAAERESALAEINATLEERVDERTRALTDANHELSEGLGRVAAMQRDLMEASRRAGMADSATAVLHNVGNALNSINVSAALVIDTLRNSKAAGLARVAEMLREHHDHLARFLTEDQRGRRLPEYLSALADAVERERQRAAEELALLDKNVDHVKVIVGMQQSYAKRGGLVETLSLDQLVDDALRFDAISYERHGIEIERRSGHLADVAIDRHKVFQIVMNLLSNARHAVKSAGGTKRITVTTERTPTGQVVIEVADSGVGIAAEHLERIFQHGFTTKKDGHGFGLHSSACAAMELGGQLQVHSDGPGRGARFRLVLPVAAQPQPAAAAS